MRLHITDNKDQVVIFLFSYLTEKLKGKEAKIILNGKEFTGTIELNHFDEMNFDWIQIEIGDDTIKIPFDDGSKVRFDRNLFYFETQSHTTLIYIH